MMIYFDLRSSVFWKKQGAFRLLPQPGSVSGHKFGSHVTCIYVLDIFSGICVFRVRSLAALSQVKWRWSEVLRPTPLASGACKKGCISNPVEPPSRPAVLQIVLIETSFNLLLSDSISLWSTVYVFPIGQFNALYSNRLCLFLLSVFIFTILLIVLFLGFLLSPQSFVFCVVLIGTLVDFIHLKLFNNLK